MSLFNTLSNFGHNVYISPFLKMIDMASKKECVLYLVYLNWLLCRNDEVVMPSCVSKENYSKCMDLTGTCVTRQDG